MTDTWSVRAVLEASERVLHARTAQQSEGAKRAELPSRNDVARTLAQVLGVDRLRLLMDSDRPLSTGERDSFRARFERLLEGEPLAYVLGSQDFYGRSFAVDARVLIPRPETEQLVREVCDRLPDGATVFEPCTGSGCIASTLALERPDLRVSASDVSTEAIELARANAKALGARVGFAVGSWWEPAQGRRFDALVANPPYVDPGRPDLLADSVRDFEPALALFADEGNPLSSYDALLRGGVDGLEADAFVFFEAGIDTSEALATRIEASKNYDRVELIRDAADIPRIVCARRRRTDS